MELARAAGKGNGAGFTGRYVEYPIPFCIMVFSVCRKRPVNVDTIRCDRGPDISFQVPEIPDCCCSAVLMAVVTTLFICSNKHDGFNPHSIRRRDERLHGTTLSQTAGCFF